jgi:hypothetical protein
MKKLFTTILAFVYIAVASGVAVNIHYCMGKLTGVDYSYNNDDTCGKCGMQNKKGCCHNDFKIVKISDDQQIAKANVDFSQSPVLLNSFVINLSQTIQGSENFLARQYHSPPDYKGADIYLYNCVFRI